MCLDVNIACSDMCRELRVRCVRAGRAEHPAGRRGSRSGAAVGRLVARRAARTPRHVP